MTSAAVGGNLPGQHGLPRRSGLRIAQAACTLGLLYAAVSVYWALGGTSLLDTIGGSLEENARAGNAIFLFAAAAAATLKVAAAVLPLFALQRRARRSWDRIVRLLAWAAAGILTIYGLVWTAVGLLVQAEILQASADAAQLRALAWHAYLWDPWFLIWGLLAGFALWVGRNRGAER